MFYQGSHARQSFSSDTFCLGLCFLHLLTGYEPYEEILKDVHCPRHLYKKLKILWLTENTESQYYIIHEVVKSLECHDNEIQGDVLFDTLYRYMVLFGSSAICSMDSNNLFSGCEVLTVLSDCLCLKMSEAQIRNALFEGFSKEAYVCLKQYTEDINMWSIRKGKSEEMKRCL